MDLKQGDLENIILNALWDLEQLNTALSCQAQADSMNHAKAVSTHAHDVESEASSLQQAVHVFVGDIQNRIQTPTKRWAYTTVKTVLDRLVDKGLAEREKEGKKYFYRSLMSRDSAGRQALQKVLRQFFKNDMNDLLRCLYELPDAADIALDKVLPTPPALSAKAMADKQLVTLGN
ncbi:MAG: BlaI/MecI/CopY family transcriptional regulator [Vampirovibrionales bacterium]|nr:BlaI/MecI/CopY family transcriptional regulator [Vampirovibrionales bacterium]